MRLVVAVALALAISGRVSAQSTATGTASTERIGAALARPERLHIAPLPQLPPVFRAEVVARPRLETPLDAVRHDIAAERPVAPALMAIPGVATIQPYTNLLYSAGVLVQKAKKVRRERAIRRARESVHTELAAFCAINDCSTPNEGLLLPR